MSSSQIKQNFHAETEKSLNENLNTIFYAGYVYQSMSSYFDRDDVGLAGFSKLFKKHFEEERDHADKLMKYINKRGGQVILRDVRSPDSDEWGNGLQALQQALTLQKQLNASILLLHLVGSTHNDAHLCNFIQTDFLPKRVEFIKKFSDLITKLNRAGPVGLGEYLFDKDLQS